ncbi:NADPH-dependent FMN reductase [Roseibium sp. M-1]
MSACATGTVTLAGIPGSLRKGSFNATILQNIEDFIPVRASLKILSLSDIPLYDADLDTDNPPEAVSRFRSAIAAADGLIIAAPEYNFGMPGVLKNALDWASRPHGSSALAGLPVLVVSSSTGALGGVRAHSQIRETLAATRSRVIPRPPVTITHVRSKIAEGKLKDEATIAFLCDALADLIAEIDLLRRGSTSDAFAAE